MKQRSRPDPAVAAERLAEQAIRNEARRRGLRVDVQHDVVRIVGPDVHLLAVGWKRIRLADLLPAGATYAALHIPSNPPHAAATTQPAATAAQRP